MNLICTVYYNNITDLGLYCSIRPFSMLGPNSLLNASRHWEAAADVRALSQD